MGFSFWHVLARLVMRICNYIWKLEYSCSCCTCTCTCCMHKNEIKVHYDSWTFFTSHVTVHMLTLELLQFTGWGRPLFSPNKHRPVSNETMFQNLISLIQTILITLFLVWLNNIFQLAQGRRRRKKKFKNMGIQSDHVNFSISENTMS